MEAFLILVFSLSTPLVVSWIKRSGWPDWGKVLLTLAVSLVGGALTGWVTGALDLDNVAGTAGIIFALAVTFYKTYFQGTELDQQLTGEATPSVPKSTFSRTAPTTSPTRRTPTRS